MLFSRICVEGDEVNVDDELRAVTWVGRRPNNLSGVITYVMDKVNASVGVLKDADGRTIHFANPARRISKPPPAP